MNPVLADIVVSSRNIDSRSGAGAQQRFKEARAPIQLLQISISQSLLGDFCNTIAWQRRKTQSVCQARFGPPLTRWNDRDLRWREARFRQCHCLTAGTRGPSKRAGAVGGLPFSEMRLATILTGTSGVGQGRRSVEADQDATLYLAGLSPAGSSLRLAHLPDHLVGARVNPAMDFPGFNENRFPRLVGGRRTPFMFKGQGAFQDWWPTSPPHAIYLMIALWSVSTPFSERKASRIGCVVARRIRSWNRR
jgi:hypothetical protein